MKLTDAEIKKTKTDPDRVQRLRDELGLYLEISTKGEKSWRLRVRRKTGDTIKTLGYYPDMGVAAARKARDLLRLAGPEAEAKPVRHIPLFKEMAREWHETNKSGWDADHAAKIWAKLEAEILPALGDKAVDEIEPLDILAELKRVEARGAEHTARKLKGYVTKIFAGAVVLRHVKANPAASLADLLKPLPPEKHVPARTKLPEFKAMLAAAEAAPGWPHTRLALRLSALTALRPGEIRHGEWAELADLDGPEPTWHIPAERMKMPRPHTVPLSRQAVETIEALRLLTGRGKLMFPAASKPLVPMNENAVNNVLERAGFRDLQSAHGFRASFSSIMKGLYRADADVIELMLAHAPKDKVAGAYDYGADHMERRRELAQLWADLILDGRPAAVDLIGLPKKSQPELKQAA